MAYCLLQWGEAQLTLGRVQVELGKYQHALRSYDRCVVRPRCQALEPCSSTSVGQLWH